MSIKRIFIGVTIFVSSYIFLFISMDKEIGSYDEGLILVGSEMVFNGRIPYKDFWTMYGPAQYYITAALFKLCGVDSIYLRLIDIFFRAIIILSGFFIIEKFAQKKTALFFSLLTLLLLSSFGTYGFPIFPAVALSLLSVLLIINHINKHKSWVYILSGMLIGIVALFRHDLAMYSFVSMSTFIILKSATKNPNQEYFFNLKIKDLHNWFCFLCGTIFVLAPISILFLLKVDINDILSSLFVIPATNYPEMRYLPFPPITEHKQLIIYMPILMVSVVSLIFIYLEITKRRSKLQYNKLISSHNLIILLFTLLLSLFYVKGIIRTQPIHLAASILVSIVTLGLLFAFYWRESLFIRSLLVILFLTSIIIMQPHIKYGRDHIKSGIEGALVFLKGYKDKESLLYLCANPIITRATCMDVDSNRLELINFIKINSLPDEPLFVGAGRHDKIYANDIDIYFLTERTPVTRWFQFEPGIQTTYKVQTEIVQDISVAKPLFIVLNSEWDVIEEPNNSRFSSGVTLLDKYLISNYRLIAEYDSFRVLKKLD